ncbi:hypothetical protein Rpal_1105 [Rhodopseudomonas palustris TIE-1]|nr:hypothetical protein Rpal_1105 [Rhodopseudomonas palustris TIE-1]
MQAQNVACEIPQLPNRRAFKDMRYVRVYKYASRGSFDKASANDQRKLNLQSTSAT